MNAENLDLESVQSMPHGLTLPPGHKDMKNADPAMCPFAKMQQNKENLPSSEAVCPVRGKEKKIKQPKGGCPFMTSEKKKNPSLECYSRNWELPYISSLKFILSFKGFLKPDEVGEKRKNFDSYPIYLQHTIFHDDENMHKARKMEMCQRFFIFDTYREKGNKYVAKGEYEEALKYYERALSCIKWLEYKKPEKKQKPNNEAGATLGLIKALTQEKGGSLVHRVNSNNTADTSNNDSREGSLHPEDSKVVEGKTKVDEQVEDTPHEEGDLEIDRDLDSLLATYTDENVILHDGDDCTEEMDKDMRKSSLLQLYLNMAVTYIKMCHFSMAKVALEDAIKVTDKSSQVYYRRSQAISCNRESTLEELHQAKKDIELAIDMKRFEKMFQAEIGVLKILNLANATEAYIEQAHFVQGAIRERREWEMKYLKELIARAKERVMLHESYGRPIGGHAAKDGNVTSLPINDEENNEYNIASEVVAKYARIMEFYQEGDKEKPENIQNARKEMLVAKDILYEMTFVRDIDFKNYKSNPLIMEILDDVSLDLDNPQILHMLEMIKAQKIKEIFEVRGNQYNFAVFRYAVDSYYKRKNDEKLAKEEEEKEMAVKPKQSFMSRLFGGFLNVNFGLQVFVLILLAIIFYYVNKNTGLFSGFKNLTSASKK